MSKNWVAVLKVWEALIYTIAIYQCGWVVGRDNLPVHWTGNNEIGGTVTDRLVLRLVSS
jgi:hypothetical protein